MAKPIEEYSDSELKMALDFDFNDWSKLMPLVVENKIELVFNAKENKWLADDYFGKRHFMVFNKNPKRALAECLLKALETKKDE